MNSGKVRLLCVIPAMTGGGAERVCLNLLRHLDYARYQVLLVCFNKEGVYLKKIPPDVQVVDLTKRHRYDIFRLIRDLRRLVDSFKPQVVMSLMHYTNIVTTLALWGKHPGLILCEHNYPPAYLSVIRMGKMKAWLMRLCYPRADKIVAISPPIRDFLINTFHVPEEKVALIANPVPMVDIQVEANERISHPLFENKQDPWFIAVGRLTPQKRFDRLIEAFALVRQRCRLV